MKKKIKAFVINHGHMDIEWYMPYDSFRFWATEAFQRLVQIEKSKKDYSTYVFDGAVILLEEIEETSPEYLQEIKRLVENGKLSIGPFYTQFDEWLPSGETIVQNCLWGNRKARKYGNKLMKAGHLLDNFGHPAQIAQILRNFGIDSLLFTRGMPEHEDKSKEFILVGKDDSEVYAVNFNYSTAFNIYGNNDPRPACIRMLPYSPEGYFSYEHMLTISEHRDVKGIAEQLIANVTANAKFYPSGLVPVFVGCDHCPPHADLCDTLAYANSIQSEIEFVTGNSEDYVNLLRNNGSLKKYKEELIGSYNDFVLFGANSARNYLKIMNFGAEINMQRYAQPLSAYASLLGMHVKQQMLDDAMKKLLINSTHDSIHGTSLDSVHIEMEYRYSSINQICNILSHEALEYIARHYFDASDQHIVCYAPNSGRQVCRVWLPLGDRGVKIFHDGAELPLQIEAREILPKNCNGQIEYRHAISEGMREVLFVGTFKANEVVSLNYSLTENTPETPYLNTKTTIENEFIEITFDAKGFSLIDKESGEKYYGLNCLEESMDYGDVWDYSESHHKTQVNLFPVPEDAQCICEDGQLVQKMTVNGFLSVPKSAIGDDRSPEFVRIPVKFTVCLYRGIKRADVRLELSNTATEHRVRLKTEFMGRVPEIFSGGIFDVNNRSVVRPEQHSPWAAPPTKLLPFREWIAVEDSNKGLGIAVKGLYDYEARYEDKKTQVYVTLFRSVGIMNRINLPERVDAPGGGIRIPGAQCLRDLTFEWSYIPYRPGGKEKYPFLKEVQRYLVPSVCHEMNDVYHLGRERRKKPFRPFEFLDENVVFSIFKQSYDQKYYVLRFYENQGKRVQERIALNGFDHVYESNMNEERIREIPIEDGKISLSVNPFRIVTILLQKGKADA